MTIDINTYLAKQYGPQPCWELVADVYDHELSAVPVDYKVVNRTVREMSGAFRLALHSCSHGFVMVPEPTDLCIVLLGKHAHLGVHHCGVYHDGSVLHAMPGTTLFEPLSVIRDTFAIVQFWARAAA